MIRRYCGICLLLALGACTSVPPYRANFAEPSAQSATEVVVFKDFSFSDCRNPLCAPDHEEDARRFILPAAQGKWEADRIRILKKLWPEGWMEEGPVRGHVALVEGHFEVALQMCHRDSTGREHCHDYPFNGRAPLGTERVKVTALKDR